MAREWLIPVICLLFLKALVCAQPTEKLIQTIEGEGLGYCENVRGSIDHFVMETVKSPGKNGYVIVRGPQKDILTLLKLEGWIKGQIEFRINAQNFSDREQARFHVVRGDHSETSNISFYISSPSDDELLNKKAAWNLDVDLKKPIVFLNDHYNDPGGLCAAIEYKPIFIEILLNNPELYGKVIAKKTSKKEFLRFRDEFLELRRGLNVSQLQFVYKKAQEDLGYNLLLVPKRKVQK